MGHMRKEIIQTVHAPAAIGVYSQAVKAGDLVFVSGQLPINPQTGEMVERDIYLQTKQSLTNIKAILDSCGLELEHVVKVTVLLADINDFAEMNRAYGEFFTSDFPARSAFAVKDLPKNSLVEIEVIAHQ